MPETVTIDKAELIALIIPGLEILWCLHCNVQNHPCRYQPKAEHGINGLTVLLEKCQR